MRFVHAPVTHPLWFFVGLCIWWCVAGVPSAQAARRGVHPRIDAARAVVSNPHLNYYGGPVIAQVQVYSVFWGPNVDSTVRSSIGGFYSAYTDSTMFDWLSEYNTNIVAQGGQQGTSQAIGHGAFAGAITITPTHNRNPLPDSDVEAELVAQINNHILPAPTSNTLFMVHFPPGMQISLPDGTRSCTSGGFCAYHNTIARSPHDVYYAVIPDEGPGSGCDTGCGNDPSPFNNLTSVASHELTEAVTDPEVGVAAGNGPPLAWYDLTNGEIGDICNGQQGNLAGYVVQLEWSNHSNRCQVAAPGTPLPTRTRTPTATSTETLLPGAPTYTPTATPSPSVTGVATPTNPPSSDCTGLAPTNSCIPGGGSPSSDCNIEWILQPVPPLLRSGLPNHALVCRNGDPSCDADLDASNHSCTFRLAMCINNNDPRLPCLPLDIDGFQVVQPSPFSSDASDQSIVSTLENQARSGFGLSIYEGGFLFSPGSTNSTPDLCSPSLDIVVPLKVAASGGVSKGRRTLTVETVSSIGVLDKDALKLTCTP